MLFHIAAPPWRAATTIQAPTILSGPNPVKDNRRRKLSPPLPPEWVGRDVLWRVARDDEPALVAPGPYRHVQRLTCPRIVQPGGAAGPEVAKAQKQTPPERGLDLQGLNQYDKYQYRWTGLTRGGGRPLVRTDGGGDRRPRSTMNILSPTSGQVKRRLDKLGRFFSLLRAGAGFPGLPVADRPIGWQSPGQRL